MFEWIRKGKRKTFAPLVTDMHCHLLPNVDDGSRNVDETVQCLKSLKQVGFEKIYFTPHFQMNYPNDEDDILNRFEKLKEEIALRNEKDLPEIMTIGGEYRFDINYARRPEDGKLLTLPGKRLLCEFSIHNNNYLPLDLFDEYIKQGYSIILAHPERYPYLSPHSNEIKALKDKGVFFQINILSLNNFYGDGARKRGFEYIACGMSEYLGTDTHNMRYINALLETAENMEVQDVLSAHKFLNSEI